MIVMKWKPVTFALYAIVLIFWALYARPWENGFEAALNSAPFLLSVALILALADYLGTKYGIAEARFDSDAGKPTEDGQAK